MLPGASLLDELQGVVESGLSYDYTLLECKLAPICPFRIPSAEALEQYVVALEKANPFAFNLSGICSQPLGFFLVRPPPAAVPSAGCSCYCSLPGSSLKTRRLSCWESSSETLLPFRSVPVHCMPSAADLCCRPAVVTTSSTISSLSTSSSNTSGMSAQL